MLVTISIFTKRDYRKTGRGKVLAAKKKKKNVRQNSAQTLIEVRNYKILPLIEVRNYKILPLMVIE